MLDVGSQAQGIAAGLLFIFALVVGGIIIMNSASSGSNRKVLLRTRSLVKEENKERRKLRRKLNKDLSVAQKLKATTDIQKTKKNAPTLARLLRSAGADIQPINFRLIFVGIAALAAGALMVGGLSPLVALGIAIAIAGVGPILIAKKMIARYQRKFTELLPQAIDVLIRGVRAGLPVSEGLKAIASEIPDPVGREFRTLADSLLVGLSLEQALTRLCERVPTQEVNFFRVVLVIQQQTGGNLTEALKNLSDMLRDRKRLKLKVKALSSEAKAGAVIIGSLPIGLSLVLSILARDYMSRLFETTNGHYILAAIGFWMMLGIFAMRMMMKFEP